MKISRCTLVKLFRSTLVAAVGLMTAVDANAAFRAGAMAVDVTPKKLPVSMTGGFTDRQGIAVQDRLHARAVALDDGTLRVAIVVVDCCLISREIFDEAKRRASKKTGIPVNRMMMSATHTHSAPTVVPLALCNPSADYVEQLTRGIADAVIQAAANLRPARIGWGSGTEPNEISNRRWFVHPVALQANPFGKTNDLVRTNPPRGSNVLKKPAGPVDPEVAILSMEGTDGKPIAVLANYGLHYVGGIRPGHLSADYFGEFARQIGNRVKGDESFVGLLSNGASGDVNNYNFLKPRPAAVPMERIAAVANRIADVANDVRQGVRHSETISLGMAERIVKLGVRKPDADDLEYAKAKLAAAANPKRLKMDEVYAQETVRIHDQPDKVSVKLQVLRIGDLGVVAIPCEVFAEIGLEIKKRSPLKSTFIVTLANGYNGYLPSPKQHALGGYETWRSGWSYLAVDASETITENVLAMLRELKPR